MRSNRRQFIQAAGTAGAALLTLQTASADAAAAPEADRSRPADQLPFTTELFLDNQLLEATPGVSRKLQPAKKHLLNPVIRPERWCEGTYIEPYTTMYDAEDKLFKMWARAGSDVKAGYIGGRVSLRPGRRLRTQTELTSGMGSEPLIP